MLAALSLFGILIVGIAIFALGFWLGMVYCASFSKTQRKDIKVWADSHTVLMAALMKAEINNFRASLTKEIIGAQTAVQELANAARARTRTEQLNDEDADDKKGGNNGPLMN